MHRTLQLGLRDLLDTLITEEELKPALRKKRLLKELRQENASAWKFLKLIETASIMTC